MTGAGLAALVLAAGKSTRMGRDKPLLALGEGTVVERVIDLFQTAGITDIRVVVGHHGERLIPVVQKAGARAVFNSGYEGGMFTSVLAGLKTLDFRCAGVFMLPVDVPLVRPSTLRRLMDAWRRIPGKGGPEMDAGRAILHPTFQGRRGHPPLIGGGHIADILKWRGDGGLRTYTAEWERCAVEIPVADRFILVDMDTPEDYRRIADGQFCYDLPSPAECAALMVEVLAVPPSVWGHCRAVADAAVILGHALNQAEGRRRTGSPLSLPLIRAAALVHDLAREQPDHARAGAAFLRSMGFDAVADIVAVHMELPPEREGRLEEAEVVFLADKLADGDVRVTLEERFRRQAARFGGESAAAAGIARRLSSAQAVRDEVERCVGRPLASILAERTHDLSASARGD
ncbi:DVU_1551 family NTP transferase [Desulfococcus sp.]|uniref:DVU_1551 family NTP transferase n=1 Tax=Desulfococcus sp. TaxID=2025834 RepID=UPI0035931EAC